MLARLKKWQHFIYYLVQRFNNTGCSHRAAALTFTSLLSLTPLMTMSFVVLAAFPEFKSFVQRIQDFIFANFVATSGQLIQHYLQGFAEHAAQLSAIGLLFLIVTAVAMMFTLEKTFNAIWQVRTSRHWLSAVIIYSTILTLSPILLGAGFAISSYLTSLTLVANTAAELGLNKPLLTIAPFLLSIIAFTLIYKAVPNCVVPFKSAFIGAVVAAILFECAKFCFTLYVKHFPTYQLLYGALAAIPIFLIWVYLSWLITLIGAVLSNGIATYHEKTKRPNVSK